MLYMNKPTNAPTDEQTLYRSRLLENLAEYERRIRATERRAIANFLRRRADMNVLELAAAIEAGAHFGVLAAADAPATTTPDEPPAIATDSRGPVHRHTIPPAGGGLSDELRERLETARRRGRADLLEPVTGPDPRD